MQCHRFNCSKLVESTLHKTPWNNLRLSDLACSVMVDVQRVKHVGTTHESYILCLGPEQCKITHVKSLINET